MAYNQHRRLHHQDARQCRLHHHARPHSQPRRKRPAASRTPPPQQPPAQKRQIRPAGSEAQTPSSLLGATSSPVTPRYATPPPLPLPPTKAPPAPQRCPRQAATTNAIMTPLEHPAKPRTTTPPRQRRRSRTTTAETGARPPPPVPPQPAPIDVGARVWTAQGGEKAEHAPAAEQRLGRPDLAKGSDPAKQAGGPVARPPAPRPNPTSGAP